MIFVAQNGFCQTRDNKSSNHEIKRFGLSLLSDFKSREKKQPVKMPFVDLVLYQFNEKPVLQKMIKNKSITTYFYLNKVTGTKFDGKGNEKMEKMLFDVGKNFYQNSSVLFLVDENKKFVIWLKAISGNFCFTSIFNKFNSSFYIILCENEPETKSFAGSSIYIYKIENFKKKIILFPFKQIKELPRFSPRFDKTSLVAEYQWFSENPSVTSTIKDIKCILVKEGKELELFLNKQNPSTNPVKLTYSFKTNHILPNIEILDKKSGKPLAENKIKNLKGQAIRNTMEGFAVKAFACKELNKKFKTNFSQSKLGKTTKLKQVQLDRDFPGFAKKGDFVWRVIISIPNQEKSYKLLIDKEISQVHWEQ